MSEKEFKDECEMPEFKSVTFRFLSWIAPRLVFNVLSRIHGQSTEEAERLHSVLFNSERVDILPNSSGGRGFALMLDQKTKIFFDQDGDKFSYDGWEVGDFDEKGDVTIFDDLKK